MGDRRVIVVDASRLGRELASGLIGCLRPEWSVETAGDTASALRAALKLAPDVVLVDTTDPASPGLELARDLRRRFPEAEIAVIRSSPRPTDEPIDDEGFHSVSKPLTANGMRRFIARLSAVDPRRFVARREGRDVIAPDVA